MCFVRCRSLALMLWGLAGVHCDAARGDAIFIEDTVIFLPFAIAPGQTEDSPAYDAGPPPPDGLTME